MMDLVDMLKYIDRGIYPPVYDRLRGIGSHVAFFHKDRQGVIVAREDYSSYPIGYYSPIWSMTVFTQFRGTVELTEDYA